MKRTVLKIGGGLAVILAVGTAITFLNADASTDEPPQTADDVKKRINQHLASHDKGLWFNYKKTFETDGIPYVKKCGPKQLKRAGKVYEILYELKLLALRGNLKPAYHPYKKCVYTVRKFNRRLVDQGLMKDMGDGWIFIPLVTQKVRAFRNTGIHRALNYSDGVCDYFAEVQLENVSLSPFAEKHKILLQRHHGIRPIFQKVVDARFCAGTNKTTGKFKWLTYER